MLFTIAQAATTVNTTFTETVTVVPPNVAVEIVKQPPSGWSPKDVLTAFLSILAVIVSFLNFYVSGSVAWVSFNFRDRVDDSNSARLWFSIRNRGRSTALVDMLTLSNYKSVDGGSPVCGGDFPLPGGPDGDYEMVEVKAGDVVAACIPLERLENHRANLESELIKSGIRKTVSFRDFYITTMFAGRDLNKKIPRKIAKKMERAVSKERGQ